LCLGQTFSENIETKSENTVTFSKNTNTFSENSVTFSVFLLVSVLSLGPYCAWVRHSPRIPRLNLRIP